MGHGNHNSVNIQMMWNWFYHEGRKGKTFTTQDIIDWSRRNKTCSLNRNNCARLIVIFRDWIEKTDTATYLIRKLPPVPRHIHDQIEKENQKLRKENEYLWREIVKLRLENEELQSNTKKEYLKGKSDLALKLIELGIEAQA